ncbi:protein MMS22-like [Sabethes cyaneus]|uniref:protein MMS22-like n=1 Tax=Sabethes cyaneus TaxID=53552 RepID=UPI00237EAB2C|nr:protein MMS22-like [Sabethes cyaneus]
MFSCSGGRLLASRFVEQDVKQLLEVNKYAELYSQHITPEDLPMRLFGFEFYYVDDDLLRVLLPVVRDSIAKLSVYDVRMEFSDKCSTIRAEINRLFRLILGYLEELLQMDSLDMISSLEDILPEIIDAMVGTKMPLTVAEMTTPTCSFYHAILDWNWLYLVLTYELKKCGECMELFETIFLRWLENLVTMALYMYKKIQQNKYLSQSQFFCPCIKKAWIGAMCLSTAENNNMDFWDYLQRALDNIETNKQKRISRKIRVPLASTTDALFRTWFMNGIVSLYEYQMLDESTFKESPVITIPPQYSILDSATKDFVNGDKPEQQMRIFLLLLKPIYSKWWPVRQEFVILLWDYFWKRLNLPFQLPTESLSNLACINRSPLSFLEQARIRASQEEFERLDMKDSSLKMYMTFLAFVVRHYTEADVKVKVQILVNRTVLRISPARMGSMTEQAVYNIGLLALTMLQATTYAEDYPRVARQFLLLKIDKGIPPTPIDSLIRRGTTITLVNVALLVACSERAINRALHVKHFMLHFEEARKKYGDRLQAAYQVLAEGLCAVFEKTLASRHLEQSDEALFGNWLGKYLRACTENDRQAVFKSISLIFDYYKRNKSVTSDGQSDILKRLYEIMLPYVKDSFSDPATQGTLIAELAASFTILTSEQKSTNSFLSLFGFFAENAAANAELRLHFVKAIVSSNRLPELDESLVIKNWVKFAILNNSNQLHDLSRVVCRMPQFIALCEIPEYDLCEEEEDPIELFFKFVGRKYKELERCDSRGQYNLTIKMHTLFQNFDKWIMKPSVAICRRIYSVLALALKECGPVIYIRGNSTCLYHIAFNQYFLPLSVLTDRNVPNDIILAMGKVWHRVMEALGSMNYSTDPVIGDHVYNMMIKWAPQFIKFKNKKDTVNPFHTFFSSQNEALTAFAFDRYSCVYVEMQGTVTKPGAEIGLKILLYMLEKLHTIGDNGKIALFIRLLATVIIDHAYRANEKAASKPIANELVQKMMQCTKNDSNLIKLEMKNCLCRFTKKYLPMETAQYFRYMNKLASISPKFIESMIWTIHSEMMETERMRGVHEDKFIRRLFEELKSAIEASPIDN